jgi:phosphoserine phosphatase
VKKITIAFDVDGTLVSNAERKPGEPVILANERIRTLLVTLASFKNVKIVVWSGSGELWARQVVNEIGITKYVDEIKAKNVIGRDENDHPIIEADITPDIAIDDIQECELGLLNLIVREK